jgi:hypothetical protein
MGLFRRVFGGGKEDPKEAARDFMRSMERLLQEEGPAAVMMFMGTTEYKELEERYWPKQLVGIDGPLHDEFVAVLAKIKSAADREFHSGR